MRKTTNLAMQSSNLEIYRHLLASKLLVMLKNVAVIGIEALISKSSNYFRIERERNIILAVCFLLNSVKMKDVVRKFLDWKKDVHVGSNASSDLSNWSEQFIILLYISNQINITIHSS